MSKETLECEAAQNKLCRFAGMLMPYAPLGGYCSCGKEIYGGENGIKFEEAATKIITNCPHCGKSFK